MVLENEAYQEQTLDLLTNLAEEQLPDDYNSMPKIDSGTEKDEINTIWTQQEYTFYNVDN